MGSNDKAKWTYSRAIVYDQDGLLGRSQDPRHNWELEAVLKILKWRLIPVHAVSTAPFQDTVAVLKDKNLVSLFLAITCAGEKSDALRKVISVLGLPPLYLYYVSSASTGISLARDEGLTAIGFNPANDPNCSADLLKAGALRVISSHIDLLQAIA